MRLYENIDFVGKGPSVVYEVVHLSSQMRYYGSAKFANDRIKRHIRKLNRGTHENHRLQADWLVDGRRGFAFNVLAVTETEVVRIVEQRLLDMNFGTPLCYNLCSHTGGPRKGLLLSDRTLRKMSTSHIGVRHTQETRRKISVGLTNRKCSDETRRKIAASLRGRKRGPMSTEWKERISIGHKQKLKDSPAHSVRLSNLSNLRWAKR